MDDSHDDAGNAAINGDDEDDDDAGNAMNGHEDDDDGGNPVDGDEEVAAFAKAPPSDDPSWPPQVDAVPYRATLQAWAEGVRAGAGLRALSADMHRRRRALDHRGVALEFARRRRAGAAPEDDDALCRSVQAALDTQVVGSCAYCGCNFSVVAAMDVGGVGMECGVCGRRVRVYNPVPVVRNPPANAEERWKGWLPW